MIKKVGRPTDNPKIKEIGIRVDKESLEILDKYCQQEKVAMAEAVRRGIKRLKADIK